MSYSLPKKRSAALFSPISSLILGTLISCFSYATPSRGAQEPGTGAQQTKQPSSAEAHFKRASAYMEENEFEKALKELNKVIALDPKHAAAHYQRGLAKHHIEDEPEGAIEDYTRAIELNPNHAEAYYQRAWALSGKNCLLYSSPSPRDLSTSRMPASA